MNRCLILYFSILTLGLFSCEKKPNLDKDASLFEQSVFLSLKGKAIGNGYVKFDCGSVGGLCDKWKDLNEVYLFSEGNGVFMLCFYDSRGNLLRTTTRGFNAQTSHTCEKSRLSLDQKVKLKNLSFFSVEDIKSFVADKK